MYTSKNNRIKTGLPDASLIIYVLADRRLSEKAYFKQAVKKGALKAPLDHSIFNQEE